MEAGLRRAVETSLSARRGRSATISSVQSVGGGCIHRASIVTLTDGERFFVKSNELSAAPMFEAEAAGLAAIAASGAIRVPANPEFGATEAAAFLVMEAIEEGKPDAGFSERFGRVFAELHRSTSGDRFGFDHDGFIGSTPQPNDWSHDWVDFWRQRRLGFQLDLARSGGRSDRELDRLGDRLLERLEEFIALPDEPACLLHGDLWSGNYLVDEAGNAVLVDPAVYYGHREADLAMTRLFGGFGPAFYAAYGEAWPLPPESESRLAVYELYHLLNHLNLFGGGYRSGCVEILRKLVG